MDRFEATAGHHATTLGGPKVHLPAEDLQTHRRHMRDYTRAEAKGLTSYDNVPGSSVRKHAAGERERHCWPAGLHRRQQILSLWSTCRSRAIRTQCWQLEVKERSLPQSGSLRALDMLGSGS